MTDDDLFATLDEILEEIIKPLDDQSLENIKALAAASNTPSLSEQEKIWLNFIKLKDSFPPKKQLEALTSFICCEEISPLLQKKAIQQFAKDSTGITPEQYETELYNIATAAKTGNRDDILAIAEGLLHQKAKADTCTLFSVFENITTQNGHLTEEFIANPSPYLKLLIGIVQQSPHEKKAGQTLETLHEHIQNSPAEKKLKPLFDKTAGTILDIQEQEQIRLIKEYTTKRKECLGITAHDNNNTKVPTKSQIR